MDKAPICLCPRCMALDCKRREARDTKKTCRLHTEKPLAQGIHLPFFFLVLLKLPYLSLLSKNIFVFERRKTGQVSKVSEYSRSSRKYVVFSCVKSPENILYHVSNKANYYYFDRLTSYNFTVSNLTPKNMFCSYTYLHQ